MTWGASTALLTYAERKNFHGPAETWDIQWVRPAFHISQLLHVQKPRETDVMSPHFANYCTVQRNREHYPERAAKWWWSGVFNLGLLTIGLPWFTRTHCSELDRRHVYNTKHYRSLASLIPESHRLPQTTAPMSYVVLLIFWNQRGKAFIVCSPTQIDLAMAAWEERRATNHRWEK